MKYRKLGKTGLKVSVVGVGTWQFGGEWGKDYSPAEAAAVLDQARELGINLIDTAECYGDHLSESLIGQYLATGRREDWVIATKFGHHLHARFDRTGDFSAQDVLKQLEASLAALRTDYIDLYQFHSGDDQAFFNDELWTMLDKQVQAGKIRHLGTSIASNENIRQTQASTPFHSQVIQVVYNRIDRQAEKEVLPSCIEQDLGVLARVPLASGYLSGKYKPGMQFTDTDVRSRHADEMRQGKLEQAQKIMEQEVPSGMNMAVWALAWCLKHPAVTCVIPGCKSPEQVAANASVSSFVSDDHPQSWKETV